MFIFFFKQKTAYEVRISDWSSDVCSSDLRLRPQPLAVLQVAAGLQARGLHLLDHVVDRARLCRRGRAAALEGIGAQRLDLVGKSLRAEGGDKIGRASCRERVGQYV